MISYCESFISGSKELLYSSVDRLRSRRRRPAIHDVAILVDQELFKVPLDPSETQDAGLFVLEPLVNGVSVVPIDVGFLHEREGHSMVELTE